MKKVVLSIVLSVIMSTGAFACVEHGVIRDMDFFSTSWVQGRVSILMWDSPGMVKIVGTLRPGALVQVLEKSEGFVKIKSSDEQGGQVGWVSGKLVETTFVQQPGDGEECEQKWW
ncbi:MAG: SH3 domain-containing protein [Deltaproteobacteria bacterium]|nr:SH3 domain-containing protein [Deltaproteobacteria bacterium]MBZ0219667.1 SH3 domain-containing protein [Deltaproteobacteria bacterium]